jgi:hypothetical protein
LPFRLVDMSDLGKEADGLAGAELVGLVDAGGALDDDEGFFAEGEAGVEYQERVPGIALFNALIERFLADGFQEGTVICFLFLAEELEEVLEVKLLMVGCHDGRQSTEGLRRYSSKFDFSGGFDELKIKQYPAKND